MSPLAQFVDEIGPHGAVAVAGGCTRWAVGGESTPGTRIVASPSGVVGYQPEEMTITVGAGTTLADLVAVLAPHRQETALSGPPGATVGGAIAIGTNSVRRNRVGLARDAVLQIRYVSAEGRLVKVGGPTVKNVAGYDVCRLLVGSLGTLGLMGEVTLRTRPIPVSQRWLKGQTDPFALWRALYRPAAQLWDGEHTWVCLEGQTADVAEQTAIAVDLGVRDEVDGPPALPPHRWSLAPSELATASLPAPFVAEIGVGRVHAATPQPARRVEPTVAALGAALKAQFDPTGRLNPGRDPWSGAGR